LLQPSSQATGGLVRITYQKRLATLDIRRAQVASVTTSGNSITSLVLDTSVNLDRDALIEENFITVVKRDGSTQMKNIEIDDINAGSGTVTVTSGFTFEDGETIEVGDYVLRGTDSTTHSRLMETAERYLLSYMGWKIFKRDSSNDAQEQFLEVSQIEQDIIQAISEPDGDVSYVAILDNQYLDSGYYD